MIHIAVRALATVASLVLSASQLLPCTAAAAVKTVEACTGLKLDGSSISLPAKGTPAKPSPDGGIYPVLFVHGFGDKSSTWTRLATVTWADTPNVPNSNSFVDWISLIPGAVPILFDYQSNSLEWVDNPAIGGALAKTIDCLTMQTGKKIAIVAHSMGGLAARQALGEPTLAEKVSLVITIGTPNLGSFWPLVLGEAARDTTAVNRWIQLASQLGGEPVTGAAFSAAYRAAQALVVSCERKIAQDPSTGICGDITPLVAAMRSHAGQGLGAGSQQLTDLPAWPKSAVTVFALASNYTGFGTDDWIGDGIVYPGSAIAGATASHVTACQLGNRPWLGDLGPRRNGCWHPDQPANQDLIPFALSKLRDDISGRSRPAVDWKNTTYNVTCDGIAQNGFQATLNSGAAMISGASAGVTGYDHFEVKFEAAVTGDVTGDNSPETAVLLYCTPQASNFFVEEVQVLSGDGKLLGELPSADSLKGGSSLPPVYVPSELTISGGNISAGMMFYGLSDSHASGPSEHRTVVWHWNGQSFTRVS